MSKPWETPHPVVQAINAVSTGPLPVLAASTAATTAFSGPEVMGLSGVLNIIGQPIKMHPRFNQNIWLLPLLMIIGVALATLVLYLLDPEDNWRRAIGQGILKGGSATWQAAVNYGGLGPKGIGILTQGTPVIGGPSANT